MIEAKRAERRARERKLSRAAILDAARRVAVREGARELSLRGVATEAGFAPAALYGYFRSKDELLLALAAEDLSALTRAAREAGGFDAQRAGRKRNARCRDGRALRRRRGRGRARV